MHQDGGVPVSYRIDLDPHILVSAIRYSLGRSTYIAGWTVEETKRVWPKLDPNIRLLIARDIREDLAMYDRLGTKDDFRTDWQGFLDWIERQETA